MNAQEPWDLDALIGSYLQHQRRTRGLREPTLYTYERFIRLFIQVSLGDDLIDPSQIAPTDVVAFFAAVRERFSPRSMKTVRTALRSFLRFLRVEGLCEASLEVAIPIVAHWRLSTLPRHLNDEQLARVLASFHTDSPLGCRDCAIVLCLSTLGLRPGEVAGLRLDDIDWRAGTLTIPTRKTGRAATLPLPRDAGRALVAYLRKDRPATAERRIFVKGLEPHRGERLSSNAISAVAVRALRRAQVEPPLAGAYIFRHTVATRLVRQGASLKEVADFLGHRSLDTTTIYAKLDLPALREVALPWPEVLQ